MTEIIFPPCEFCAKEFKRHLKERLNVIRNLGYAVIILSEELKENLR